jgi:xanthine dehydrogenase YagS FAD-binding subunit
MRRFEYSSATSLAEAMDGLATNRTQPDVAVRPLAGGTDLLTLMKGDIVAPSQLIDIKRVAEIPQGVDVGDDGTMLGALTTLSEVTANPQIQQHYPLLAQAIGLAATPQLRNMATVGGNLLQRPRCWYFRHAHFHCWLKGGEECPAVEGQNQHHALFGSSPCVAVHPSDLAPALLALDAEVQLRGPHGSRSMPLAEFLVEPTAERRVETRLEADELLLAVRLPTPAANSLGVYCKAMDRKVWAFALASVAVLLQMEGPKVGAARVVLGGVAPIPWRVVAAEQALIGQTLAQTDFAHVAELALAEAQPLQENGYKVPLSRGLVVEALEQIAARAQV